MRNLCLSLSLTLCFLIAIWFALPDFGRYQIRVVSASEVFVFGGQKNEWPLSFATNKQRADLARTRPADGVFRQASFALPNSDGVTIIVARLKGKSGLWVNNIPLGIEAAVPRAGPALGPRQIHARVAPIFLGFSPNRFDVLAPDGFGWRGVGPIWYGDLERGAELVSELEIHQEFLVKASFWIGLLGMLMSAIGLFFQANRWVFGVGLAISTLFSLQGQAFMPVHLLSMTTLVVSIIFLLAIAPRNYWFLSLAGCSALAGVAGLAVFAFALPPPLYLKLASFSVVGVWPLVGIALPILAADKLRGLGEEFVVARARIANQEIIIQSQEADLHAVIRSSAIHEERQRFVRDMHDGVGGQLLSLLMQMRSKTIAPEDVELELQRGLHDLRLMADSLDHVGSDLDLALTAFERRAAQQLAAAGVALSWSKGSDLNLLAWDGRKILNLYRILQEILTNCIRHSEATSIAFVFGLDVGDKGLNVTITDDGIGMGADIQKGRGLINIAKRAAALGASVSYASGPGGAGTQISLRPTI